MITAAQIKNGWTEKTVEKYLRTRDLAVDLVGGFVVTHYTRPPDPIVIENTKKFNPHNHRVG